MSRTLDGAIELTSWEYQQQRQDSLPLSSKSVISLPRKRVLAEAQEPGFFFTVFLLVLLGLRPKRLQRQLEAEDPRAWNDFRDGLIKRWGTLGITSGLVLSATTTMIVSNLPGVAMVAAIASLCGSIVSIVFGTALSFIFTDAPAKDFMVLASRPFHMIFLLSIPNLFAMGSMLALFISITALAWSYDGLPATFAKTGTTLCGVILVAIFAYSVWLLGDMMRSQDEGKRNNNGREDGRLLS